MVDKKTLDRWMNEYIETVDISKRKYTLLSSNDLKIFVINNYYDMYTDRIVTGENDYMPIGLQYLDYLEVLNKAYGGDVKFLVCYAKNGIGKNTILSELRYYDNCNELIKDQQRPVTYIEYAEVNRYFREKGLYQDLIKEFAKIINPNNPLLTTNQSMTGYHYNVYEKLVRILTESGFNQDIRNEFKINHDYYDFLKSKPKELIKSKKDI